MVSSLGVKKYKRGQHPNSQKNLVMGTIRENIDGIPANREGSSLKDALKIALRKPPQPPGEGATQRERLVYSTLEGAVLREPTPFREVWDRMEGRLSDTPEIKVGVNVVFVIGRGYKDIPQLGEGNGGN